VSVIQIVVITTKLLNFLFLRSQRVAEQVQDVDQFPKTLFRDMPRHFTGVIGKRFVDLLEQLKPLLGDPRKNNAAIGRISRAFDPAGLFDPIEQSRDIGIVCHHALADLSATQSLWTGATQDSKDVVLSGGDVPALQELGSIPHHDVGRALQADIRLLGDALEGLGLLDLCLNAFLFEGHDICDNDNLGFDAIFIYSLLIIDAT